MAVKQQNRLRIFLKDKNKKSIFKMFRESLYLWISKREIPFYYFKYLYRKNVVNYKDYISTKEAHKIQFQDTFHKPEHLSIISNKLSFSIFCEQNKLPAAKLISHNLNSNFIFKGKLFKVATKEDLYLFFEHVFNNTNHENIFVKPLSMYGGTGCYRINKQNLQKGIDACNEFVINNSCIHEEVVLQHPEINKIHAGCINTIRMETFIDKQGTTHLLSAFMRFGVGKSFVDNAHSGGFYVGIDLENGTLKDIGHQYMEYGGATLTAHPDNNFAFGGFKIPLFKEAVELTMKSVDYIPDRYIGWDIAISTNGPVIIEANEYPSIFMSDIAYGGYLKHPLYKGILEEIRNS